MPPLAGDSSVFVSLPRLKIYGINMAKIPKEGVVHNTVRSSILHELLFLNHHFLVGKHQMY